LVEDIIKVLDQEYGRGPFEARCGKLHNYWLPVRWFHLCQRCEV